MFCQFWPRRAYAAAVAVSPAVAASREMAKSSIDHSRVSEAPCNPWSPCEVASLGAYPSLT